MIVSSYDVSSGVPMGSSMSSATPPGETPFKTPGECHVTFTVSVIVTFTCGSIRSPILTATSSERTMVFPAG